MIIAVVLGGGSFNICSCICVCVCVCVFAVIFSNYFIMSMCLPFTCLFIYLPAPVHHVYLCFNALLLSLPMLRAGAYVYILLVVFIGCEDESVSSQVSDVLRDRTLLPFLTVGRALL